MKACQDVSTAGLRRGVRPGTRSGLWTVMAQAVDALQPRLVVIENVRGLLSADAHCDVEPCPFCVGDGSDSPLRALGAVLGDLAELGYDARWGGVRASDAGAPHRRERVFIVAYPAGVGWERPWGAWDGRAGFADGGVAAAHASGDGRKQRGAEPARVQGGPDAAVGGASDGLTLLPTPAVNDMGAGKTVEAWDAWTADMQARHGHGNGHGKSLAIEAQRLLPTPRSSGRHETRGGDRAGEPPIPGAVQPDRFGQYQTAIDRWAAIVGPPPPPVDGGRLNPDFCEWMMGWPVGWTDVGIPRTQRLKICGNGVVPHQAELALRLLLGAP